MDQQQQQLFNNQQYLQQFNMEELQPIGQQFINWQDISKFPGMANPVDQQQYLNPELVSPIQVNQIQQAQLQSVQAEQQQQQLYTPEQQQQLLQQFQFQASSQTMQEAQQQMLQQQQNQLQQQEFNVAFQKPMGEGIELPMVVQKAATFPSPSLKKKKPSDGPESLLTLPGSQHPLPPYAVEDPKAKKKKEAANAAKLKAKSKKRGGEDDYEPKTKPSKKKELQQQREQIMIREQQLLLKKERSPTKNYREDESDEDANQLAPSKKRQKTSENSQQTDSSQSSTTKKVRDEGYSGQKSKDKKKKKKKKKKRSDSSDSDLPSKKQRSKHSSPVPANQQLVPSSTALVPYVAAGSGGSIAGLPESTVFVRKDPRGVYMTTHGKPVPMDIVEAEIGDRIFQDIDTKEKWLLDPTKTYQIKSKYEAMIQFPGNWRLYKNRKIIEQYDCLQCGCQLFLTRHPAFCEVALMPPQGVNFDPSNPTYHEPYSSMHQKIKGTTHCNVRYFAKKHCDMVDDPLMMLAIMSLAYPKYIHNFNPDMKKFFDIGYRERKMKLYEQNPSEYANPGSMSSAHLNAELYQAFRRFQVDNNLAKKVLPSKNDHLPVNTMVRPPESDFMDGRGQMHMQAAANEPKPMRIIPCTSMAHDKMVLPKYEHRKVYNVKKDIQDKVYEFKQVQQAEKAEALHKKSEQEKREGDRDASCAASTERMKELDKQRAAEAADDASATLANETKPDPPVQVWGKKRDGILGHDEPQKILGLIHSVCDSHGFDYLLKFKQPNTNPEDEPVEIRPIIVPGSQLVVECPMLYRDFIEKQVLDLKSTQLLARYKLHQRNVGAVKFEAASPLEGSDND